MKNFLITSLFFISLGLLGANSACNPYMETCLISEEEERVLLSPSNRSYESMAYKSIFSGYKMLHDDANYNLRNLNSLLGYGSSSQEVNQMKQEYCDMYITNPVSSWNELGLGPVLLELFETGKNIYCKQ